MGSPLGIEKGMTQQKDGPRHYELQHRVAGIWREMAVYEMFPRYFRNFLSYLDQVHNHQTPEDRENTRVVPTDTVWGNAEYAFNGKDVTKIKNDNGYDPK